MKTLRLALGWVFLGAAAMKLAGNKELVRAFDRWGDSDAGRLLAGVGELAGAALLLNRRTASAGAAELGPLMAGAAYTHLNTPGERALARVPLATLALLGMVAAKSGKGTW